MYASFSRSPYQSGYMTTEIECPKRFEVIRLRRSQGELVLEFRFVFFELENQVHE